MCLIYMYSRRTLKPPKLLLQTNATTFFWCPHRPIDFTGDAKATFALARQRAQSAPHVRMPVGRQESGQSHLVLCGGNSFTFQPCHFPGILAGWRRPWSLRDLRRWEFLLFGCPAWSQGINSFIYIYLQYIFIYMIYHNLSQNGPLRPNLYTKGTAVFVVTLA